MAHPRIDISIEKIAEFCRKWQITEFALFGSVLRDDFGPESDIDVMVTFAPEAPWTLFDLVELRDELIGIFNREVDLVERPTIEQSANPYRRQSILAGSEVIYEAA